MARTSSIHADHRLDERPGRAGWVNRGASSSPTTRVTDAAGSGGPGRRTARTSVAVSATVPRHRPEGAGWLPLLAGLAVAEAIAAATGLAAG